MAKTRFICTIGPKTLDREWLIGLHGAGMNIARVNGAHGSLEQVAEMIDSLQANLPEDVEILLDLPGNKVRTDNFDEPVPLTQGEEFILKPENLTYRPLYKSLKGGERISAADGAIQLEVTKVDSENIHTKVIVGGPLATRKGINIRGIHGEIPFDFERDISLLNIAIEKGIDMVGLSFVRAVEQVRRTKAQLSGTGIEVVAKVETAEAVTHLDQILCDADLIMIDRGDLEAEIGKENVPLTQKAVIKRAKELDVEVIIASQFLTSMLDKPLPFMAEVSDVANAVLDGADILMLSEETAIGEFPVECIAMMSLVAETVEDARRREIEAVILSAGPSTGFGSLTTNKHKCMLDVGGSTILAHQLDNLLLAGVASENVSVVTGSNYRQIEHYLMAEGFRGSFVHNPWFQTTNMATSLWLARKDDSNLIIVYGDIVFEQSILEDLLATEGDIVCVVDRKSELDAEDEKVLLEDDLIMAASKELDPWEANGEFIGLARLSRRGARKVFAELDRMVHNGDMMAFFSEILSTLAKAGISIDTCFTNGRAWSDNDTLADLGNTRESVYPRIREARRTQFSAAPSELQS